MRKNLLSTLFFPILLLSLPAVATEFKSVGESRLEYYFWDVYDAKLFTPSGVYKAGKHPIKLSLTYLRDFAAIDIVKATNEQWQHLGKTDLVGRFDQSLLNLWPDIKEGETLAFITDTKGVGVFYHQGEKLGSVDDANFANDFLAIWLSPKTSQPQMRKQLIGEQ